MARKRTSMPARKRKPRKKAATPKRLRMDNIPTLAMSVDQFCHAHNLNRDTFYELLKEDKAPDCILTGKRRRLISFEAAARWRAEREADAKAQKEAAA
ncbi:hypothetical protein AB7M17_003950 [Bradyrhizobium sp. USDA 377]